MTSTAEPDVDFPVAWHEPDDAELTWEWDDMHMPIAVTPLSGDYNLLMGAGFAYGYERLAAAGLNDWGGVSPLTPDHINPERPWPQLGELRRRTEAVGHELRERLAIYPEYAGRAEFVDERLRPRVSAFIAGDGLVRPELEQWRAW